MRQSYPSDISRQQFELIRYIFESARKTTHPRKYDLYDIFCAVLYVLSEKCTWRSLPKDFPKWNIVYYYFKIWDKSDDSGISLLEKAFKELGFVITTET